LKAVTRPLEAAIDLNDFARGDGVLFVRDGVGIAGRGVAARVPRHAIGQTLSSIERDDTVGVPGCGPVAFAALPFIPGAPAEFVIPEVAIGKDGNGQQWITTIDGASADLTPPPTPLAQGGTFTITPGFSPDDFRRVVAAGRDAVRAGALTKVVLARDLWVDAQHPLDVHAILLRLRAAFGSSYRYSVEGFVGASPELLVTRSGDLVRSHPLAGTAARTGDPATDARLAEQLIASTKDQIEHRIVIDVVNNALLPYCSYLDWEFEPSIVTVANVQHLGTAVEGRLSSPPPSVLELVDVLQPTPALGGHPRADALRLIAQLEPFDRGRYGGAVGWVDADGNGTWAVGIRCAEITGHRAHLFAGVGVVAESDPHLELAETQAKFQAMLSAIVRP
jgi:isochorismate synthase